MTIRPLLVHFVMFGVFLYFLGEKQWGHYCNFLGDFCFLSAFIKHSQMKIQNLHQCLVCPVSQPSTICFSAGRGLSERTSQRWTRSRISDDRWYAKSFWTFFKITSARSFGVDATLSDAWRRSQSRRKETQVERQWRLFRIECKQNNFYFWFRDKHFTFQTLLNMT